MPKIKYISSYSTPKNVPPPDMVEDLFRRYMKAAKVTNVELSRRLGISTSAIGCKFNRGTWTTKDVKNWCRALGITDPAEVGKAILYGD